jgi:hypothetical protein
MEKRVVAGIYVAGEHKPKVRFPVNTLSATGSPRHFGPKSVDRRVLRIEQSQ